MIAAVLALLGGLLQAASFAPTHAWPLQLAGLALLVALAHGATPKRAAGLGWLFGLAWITGSVWWVYTSMHRYGGMPAPLAGLATGLLGATLALYYAAAAAAWARWGGPGSRAPALAFAACWLLAEWARGTWLTGFPWAAGGYAHTVGPLAGWAPWIGVYGIGLLAAWWAAAAGLAWHARRTPGRALRGLAAPTLLALMGLLLPAGFTQSSGMLTVTLLQPATAQDSKFDPDVFEHLLRWHVEALAAARGTLVVTPESSLPLPAPLLGPDWAEALRQPFAQGDRAALVGLFVGDDQAGYTNSLVGLSPVSRFNAADTYVYGKRHLLPFGEFIPPGFGWFVALMNIPIGNQEHGRNTGSLTVAGQRVRPLICYEDLFGEDFVDSVVGDGAATVLANATNLAWFGPWMVQDQHLQFSQMRALEFQRPVVRATNTGATAVVDHRGQVTARLASEQAGALEAEVEGRTGATPYARWLAAAGLWPWPLLALAVLVKGRRRPRANP